ncbi:MAG: hypothetical protein V7K46_28340 [Nostoc sp.]
MKSNNSPSLLTIWLIKATDHIQARFTCILGNDRRVSFTSERRAIFINKMLPGIKQILPHKLFCGQSQNAIASCTASLDSAISQLKHHSLFFPGYQRLICFFTNLSV